MEETKKLSADSVNANSKANEIRANDKKKNKKKGNGFFARIGRKLKEMWSELKLVSWPTLPKVVKQTGVVLVVVLAFLVCIGLFDWPLSIALRWITGN